MRATDLRHEELLECDSQAGVIRFAGQRALVFDAVAMGLLRKSLVEDFGLPAARVVLTQFGFAQGWRLAEAMKSAFPWEDEGEWQRAGTRLHALAGLFSVADASEGPRAPEGVTLLDAWEAEQHLLHFGRADQAVCWTLCGVISGYLSRAEGQEIFVLEDHCVGRGDEACHLRGRTRAEWGEARAQELHAFQPDRLQDCLGVSLQRVTQTLQAAEQKLRTHHRALTRVARDLEPPAGVVASSAPMRKVVDLARRVARGESTVLITGESGSGKERIARLVHDESPRRAGRFIAVNCGAIAETLLESELFGHARGAFTGATRDRPGLFEAAHQGTLLLDEVGEMSAGMQVKLLRTLQEHEVRRVGENQGRPVDVRIVAATNRDLAQAVAQGTFRQDLYYRLKVVELRVPPLRERRDDLLPLARALLTSAAQRLERPALTLSPAAADQLLRYAWPGNVRELENAMERAVALARDSRVEPEDLPEEVRQAVPAPLALVGQVRPLEDIEKDYILAALGANGGNQTRTAEQLHIGAATMYRKLKGYGLIPDRRPPAPVTPLAS